MAMDRYLGAIQIDHYPHRRSDSITRAMPRRSNATTLIRTEVLWRDVHALQTEFPPHGLSPKRWFDAVTQTLLLITIRLQVGTIRLKIPL